MGRRGRGVRCAVWSPRWMAGGYTRSELRLDTLAAYPDHARLSIRTAPSTAACCSFALSPAPPPAHNIRGTSLADIPYLCSCIAVCGHLDPVSPTMASPSPPTRPPTASSAHPSGRVLYPTGDRSSQPAGVLQSADLTPEMLANNLRAGLFPEKGQRIRNTIEQSLARQAWAEVSAIERLHRRSCPSSKLKHIRSIHNSKDATATPNAASPADAAAAGSSAAPSSSIVDYQLRQLPHPLFPARCGQLCPLRLPPLLLRCVVLCSCPHAAVLADVSRAALPSPDHLQGLSSSACRSHRQPPVPSFHLTSALSPFSSCPSLFLHCARPHPGPVVSSVPHRVLRCACVGQ